MSGSNLFSLKVTLLWFLKQFDLPIQIPLYAMYLIFLQLSKYVFYCKLKAIWALKADREAIDSQ